jgi:hypothetical protein
MIFRQELLDAAVSLCANIIPKGIMITNLMPVLIVILVQRLYHNVVR